MSDFNQEQQERAIPNYTELMRRVSVGAYTERSAEHFETGTYPEDGVEESIDNLEELVAKRGLEFVYSHDTNELAHLIPKFTPCIYRFARRMTVAWYCRWSA